jgi:hypothetical protein
MQYLVIETFRGGDPTPVYSRFHAQGRMAPAGLDYVASWVTTDGRYCYQIMKCEDRELLDSWMNNWSDLVSFEVIPVITSAEAAEQFGPKQ